MSVKLEIIENFLSKEDLSELQSINLQKTNYKQMNVYVNKIKDNLVSGKGINEDSVKRLNKNYHSKAISILNKLYPEKAKLYEYSEFGITDTGPDYEFPIHNDTPNKLLSGVIYISPLENVGTKFYSDKKGRNERYVDWKINRAVFFSRLEKKTWHSYQGNGKTDRIALVFNLKTNNIKKVFEIENKNFILGYLRYKLNPYLYKFLKFTL